MNFSRNVILEDFLGRGPGFEYGICYEVQGSWCAAESLCILKVERERDILLRPKNKEKNQLGSPPLFCMAAP